MFAKYVIFLLLYLPFLLSAMLLAPLLPLFARPEFGLTNNASATGIEPRLRFSLYMTPDNSLLGDESWKKKHPAGTYWDQVCWLWRNPAYGFAWGPLAHIPGEAFEKSQLPGDGGYLILGNDGAFEWTEWWPLPLFGGYLKTRFGWILGNAMSGKPCLFLCSVRLKRERT